MPTSPDNPKISLDLNVLQIRLFHGSSTIHALLAMTYSGLAHQAAMTLELARLEAAGKMSPQQKEDYKFTKLVNSLNSEQAKAGAEAAAIIYAHSILDALVFGLCKFLTKVEPDSWFPLVKERKVSFQDVRSKTVSKLQLDLLEGYLEQLERQSLLLKCDILFKVIRPSSLKGILSKYRYSRDRLMILDKTRHDLVHKLKFHPKLQQSKAKVDYLLNTGQFFLNLARSRLQLSPAKSTLNPKPRRDPPKEV